MPADNTNISYLTVLISQEGIAEMDGASRAVFVPRTGIQTIELMSGTAAEKPLLQLVLAALLVAGGLFSLQSISLWFTGGGTLTKLQLGLVVFMFVGLWLLFEVLRKRIYLLVSTPLDTRKIVFRGAVESRQISDFIRTANHDFGYNIRSRIRDVQDT